MARDESARKILVCCGTGCIANGAMEVYEGLRQALAERRDIEVYSSDSVAATGCHGLCSQGPFVRILPEDITYCQVKARDVEEIVQKTLIEGQLIERLMFRDRVQKQWRPKAEDFDFYKEQTKIALRNVGQIDPSSLDDYLDRDGYKALQKALQHMSPSQVIDEVIGSGLRGRGGAGFSTGQKWLSCAGVPSQTRYIICNGDEGDPGAFMDESMMEGDPHSILEGMLLCAYATGASKGYIYVRDEYATSVKRLQKAIHDAGERGYLGTDILGSGLNFDIQIVRGGGAFVCGEETALMRSIEGDISEPRDKYIFPSEKGLWGQPTVINNVETWVNVPVIILHGAEHFASTGTAGSKGTKVFSVVGKVNHTGLVEVPMGTTLRHIVENIAGGVPRGRKLKAVQTGGPSGGCIPEAAMDIEVDFDSLVAAGSMMGSGGIIVMDDRTCMVEVARYYTNFLAGESCGKCAPCREGITSLLEILNRICHGQGELADLESLEEIGETMQMASLCALGRTAPNPVLSTLRYFRDEYLEHITHHRCPAGVCPELTELYIDEILCNGCTLCVKHCPTQAITGEAKKLHVIDQDLCIRCGECVNRCPQNAILVR